MEGGKACKTRILLRALGTSPVFMHSVIFRDAGSKTGIGCSKKNEQGVIAYYARGKLN